MFQVSVEEEFAAGHALRGYRGKCENPHGHNYKVRVTLQGASLDSIGLLYDFSELKKAIHQTIGRLDHQFMNDLAPFDALNPSAENIAKYLYDQIAELLSQRTPQTGGNCRVSRVKVWETSTTSATYSGDARPDSV